MALLPADEGAYAEARCDGLNGRFDAIKFKGNCQHGKGDKGHGRGKPWDRDSEERLQPPQPEEDAEFEIDAEQLRDAPPHAQKESQGRHLLDHHKDKHNKHAGKHLTWRHAAQLCCSCRRMRVDQ